MTQLMTDAWDAAYTRGDNQMLYPKEEVVKFLNRCVRKRISPQETRDILQPRPGASQLSALDFGCGIGRLTVLLEEFGIEAHGVDISPVSLDMARQLASDSGYPELLDRLHCVDGFELPFETGAFDVGIAAGVLDSMRFDVAQVAIKELDRVVSRCLYVDLISGDNDRFHREFAEEEVVDAEVERGTVQSYFNFEKIRALFAPTSFKIDQCRLVTEQSCTDHFRYARYHVYLTK